MEKQISIERITSLAVVAGDMAEVKDLSNLVRKIKTGLELLEAEKAEAVARYDLGIAEVKATLEEREAELAEVAGRLDRALFEIFQTAPAGGLPVEKVKAPRARKGAAQEVAQQVAAAEANLEEAVTPGTDEGAQVEEPAALEADPVVCLNSKCENYDAILPGNCAIPPDARGGHPLNSCPDFKAELEEIPEQAPAEESRLSFSPLVTQVGDCEVCSGWGVVDGELYGEFALVPCICDAGQVVAGKVVAGKVAEEAPAAPLEVVEVVEVVEDNRGEGEHFKCCEECQIEDPECANCQLPDAEAEARASSPGVILEVCASGPCTATGKKAKDVCRRVGIEGRPARDCSNFVPVDKCQHSKFKRTVNPDGSEVCDLCGVVVKAASVAAPEASAEPGAGVGEGAPVEPVKNEVPELTELQQKCPHPPPFRETVAGIGERCKVCQFVVKPAAADPVPGACDCPLTKLKWITDAVGIRLLICPGCGKVHNKKGKDGKELAVEPGERISV